MGWRAESFGYRRRMRNVSRLVLVQIATVAALFVVLALLIVVRLVDVSSSDDVAAPDAGDGAQVLIDIPADKIEDRTAQSEVLVEVIDNAFRPQFFSVKAGTVIHFENRGGVEHDVSPDVEGWFEASPRLAPGDSFDLTPDGIGDIGFFCSIHGLAGKDGKPGRIQAGVVRVVA